MQSFFSRHRRRASPRPPEERSNEDLSFTSPNNRRRRRQLKDTEGASLLPLTYQQGNHTSTPGKQRLASSPLVAKSTNSNISRHYGAAGGLPLMAPGSSTCNSFLMGGHYYPGKDKKRKQYFQRRRYTCWHRVFCSAVWRMVGSTIIVAYLMVWHVIVPATDIVLEYGRFWSGPPSHERKQYELRLHRRKRRKTFDDIHGTIQWLLHDATLHLPSLQQRRDEMEKLQGERERIHFGSEDRFQLRKAIWEEIVPDWFHRNDPNPSNSEGTGSTGNAGGGREEESKRDSAAYEANNHNGETAEQHRIQSEENRDIGEAPDNPEGRRRLLTLENMDEFVNQTSCPELLSPDNITTTLVIQSSLERMWILEETCRRWKNPMVVVLWFPPSDSVPGTKHDSNNWSPSWKDSCTQMTLIQYQASPDEDMGSYPVNHLRNLGLQAVTTSHVLVMDIDFVPSHHLHLDIQTILLEQKQQQHHPTMATSNKREAVVVPAFERLLSTPCLTVEECKIFLQQDTAFLPRTFPELQDCVASDKCSVFQSQVNWEGHYSTRSESWLAEDWYDKNESATEQGGDAATGAAIKKSIKSIRCFDSLRYEPYVVLRWCPAATATVAEQEQPPKPVAPFYDERFFGYGKNKIEMISHLRFMGYRFAILPRGFLIHHPHPESVAKETWTGRRSSTTSSHYDDNKKKTAKTFDLHQAMDRLYSEFLTQLTLKYQDQMHDMIQPCSHNGD